LNELYQIIKNNRRIIQLSLSRCDVWTSETSGSRGAYSVGFDYGHKEAWDMLNPSREHGQIHCTLPVRELD